jgi:glyoxylase-like metal-dependent hydrolase (beta-lactamase superfamily II)
MKLQSFCFNPLQENTYLIWCEKTLDCAIVDAGMYDSAEQKLLQDFIESNNLTPTMLLGTHAHIDHIFGNWWVKQIYDLPYYLHPADVVMIDRSETMAALWNLKYTPSPLPTNDLSHGDIISIGASELQVRFVPGHAPGHVIFIDLAGEQVLVGDTIFRGSIGRTDLPGGNHEQLLKNIEAQIFTLPNNYTLYSGHGPSTTVGFEKENNPFFQS